MVLPDMHGVRMVSILISEEPSVWINFSFGYKDIKRHITLVLFSQHCHCRVVHKDVFRRIWRKIYSGTSRKGYRGISNFIPQWLPILVMNSISYIALAPICEFSSLQNTLREYGGRDLVSSVTNVAFVHVSHL